MNEFDQSLKNHKLKITSARKVIFEVLAESPRALTPKEVFGQVEDATDLVSVYRNLTLFAEIGIAHRFQDGRYSLCQHKHEVSHVHVMVNCQSCGLTKEIDEHSSDICKIASRLREYSQPLVNFESLVLQGKCGDCSP